MQLLINKIEEGQRFSLAIEETKLLNPQQIASILRSQMKLIE